MDLRTCAALTLLLAACTARQQSNARGNLQRLYRSAPDGVKDAYLAAPVAEATLSVRVSAAIAA